nr:leucine zipper domain-containing protein [Methylocystis echinoides]
MNIHKNARLTPLGRVELARRVLEGGEAVAPPGRPSSRIAGGPSK